MSISCLSCPNALASTESGLLHAINVKPTRLASNAPPETPIPLFPIAAATPAADVPCPSPEELGVGSESPPQ